MESALTHLECPECGKRFDAHRVQTICGDCKSPLLARSDLEKALRSLDPKTAAARPRGLWRWAEILPVRAEKHRLTLGEGDTPLLPAARLGESLGLNKLFVKDESPNPTGSFKARGLAVAVSKAIELKVADFVIPTAGNAGGALAAYAARAKVEVHVFMPKDAPPANQLEVRAFGADLVLVDGLISDAGRLAAAEAQEHKWFDVSTSKEPYRLEGAATWAALKQLARQGWMKPDESVVLFNTGSGLKYL